MVWKSLLIVIIIIAVLAMFFSNSLEVMKIIPPPLENTTQTTSINWAGYVVQTNLVFPEEESIDVVEGSWIVPSVNCFPDLGDYSSSFWIGIDGYSSPSVEQIGTGSDCYKGFPLYYAWYELYPFGATIVDLIVSPGDKVTARVEHLGNDLFVLTLTSSGTSRNFTLTQECNCATKDSAEWIAEAPSITDRILPLADFNSVNFTDVYVTVKGERGSIDDPRWQSVAVIMREGTTVKATPTNLENNGTSFSIIWQHN